MPTLEKNSLYGDGYTTDENVTTGYPRGVPKYISYVQDAARNINPNADGVSLAPNNHFAHHQPGLKNPNADNNDTFIRHMDEHFTRDINEPGMEELPTTVRNLVAKPTTNIPQGTDFYSGYEQAVRNRTASKAWQRVQQNKVPVFSGSTTNVNPFDDPNVDDIITNGLHEHEKQLFDGKEPRISPILPFTRSDPQLAQATNYYYYNRTKLPVADLEWRKGFRHIFITRPECYIMGTNNGQLVLSEQCEKDRDFSTAFHQFPHLLELLSPSYITGSFSNFNFMLSNRVMSMNTTGTQVGVDETVQKSSDGYTITPSGTLQSSVGSTLELTFKDTKRLEVYNYLRLQMLYQFKTYEGFLSPSYNGYQYQNTYAIGSGSDIDITGSKTFGNGLWGHPYDRALDYCSSIFDVVTNESGTQILYWCKYYGVYPVTAQLSGINNNNGQALTNEMTVSAQFRYQYKLEMNEQSFVEFNYNAGVVNANGSLRMDMYDAQPWDYYRDSPRDDVNYQSKTYMGASSMWVGTPYIVLDNTRQQVNPNYKIYSPFLMFKPLYNSDSRAFENHDYHSMNNYIEHEYPSRYRPTAFTSNPTNTGLEEIPDSLKDGVYDYYTGYEQAVHARMETSLRKPTIVR